MTKDGRDGDRSAPVAFVILTITRSGSTWLVSLLNSQPAVAAYEELFLQESDSQAAKYTWLAKDSPPRYHKIQPDLGVGGWRSVRRYLRYVRDFAGERPAYGFKLMLSYRNLGFLAMTLLHRYRLICLIRDDVFEGAVSRLMLDLTGDAHGRSSARNEAVHVDPEALVREMKKRRLGIRGLGTVARLWPWRKLVVRYDDLRDDREATMRRILSLLGVADQAAPVESTLVRRVQTSYDEILANADEIRVAVQRARLGRYLPASLL